MDEIAYTMIDNIIDRLTEECIDEENINLTKILLERIYKYHETSFKELSELSMIEQEIIQQQCLTDCLMISRLVPPYIISWIERDTKHIRLGQLAEHFTAKGFDSNQYFLEIFLAERRRFLAAAINYHHYDLVATTEDGKLIVIGLDGFTAVKKNNLWAWLEETELFEIIDNQKLIVQDNRGLSAEARAGTDTTGRVWLIHNCESLGEVE
jgi:hypothetical protein